MAAPNPSAAGTGYTRLETPRSLSFAVVAAAERGRHLLSPPAGTPPGSRPKSNNGTSRRGGLSVASLDHPNRDVDGDRPSDFVVMFTMRGSVIPGVAGMCMACVLVGLAGLYIYSEYNFLVNDYMHKIMIVPLGFLLVFRSNLAYGRFWESRGHIGKILRHSRSMAMFVGVKTASLTQETGKKQQHPVNNGYTKEGSSASNATVHSRTDATELNLSEMGREMAIEMQRLIILLYYVIVHTLRSQKLQMEDPLMQQLTPEETAELTTAVFMPIVVIRWALQHTQTMGEAGVLAWWEQAHLLSHFDGLLESAVGAHKVASTPVPFPYTQLLSWLVNVFVCTVPLAVASAYAGGGPPEEALSPLTIGLVSFASAVIALALLGINETAAELEAPFGYDPNDIKLGKLGEAMEIDVAVLLRGTSFAQALIAQRSAAAAKIAAPKKK